jgi:hypothetical protein
MIPFPVPSMMPTTDRLKAKRGRITALCDALEDFLAFDIDSELAAFEKMQSAPPSRYVTPEMLVTAQAELQRMETQLDSFTVMQENFSEELAPMFGTMRSMLEGLLGPSLEHQRNYVKSLQDYLDGKTSRVLCGCGASLMADGSAHRGFVQSGEVFAGTREECDVKARECGWAVNGDEHKCPECAAK